MGDVIQFKPSKKLETINAQMILEEAITDTWAKLGGLNLVMGIREYHLAFLRFSDVCFQLMEQEKFVVDEDQNIHIEEKAMEKLKYYLDKLERK